jgi:DNA-binding transcriptional ArsR family regulator
MMEDIMEELLDEKVEQYAWDRVSGRYVPVAKAREEDVTSFSTFKRFLKGPIPWQWIIRASQLPGKAFVVGLCLWRLKGAMKKDTIKLSNAELEPFGIDRAAKSRALSALEKAGLITVERSRGRWPVVTLLEHPRKARQARA